MKNRLLVLTTLAGVLAASAVAHAQDATTGVNPGKIGVINIQQAIASTAEGKQALADIQKKYEPRRKELETLQEEIAALQDQLQKQAATLSDQERARLSRELDDKQKVFKRKQEDDQSDFQADNQEAANRIGQKMVRLINDYAQQNGLALVLDSGQLPIYYVAKGIDITNQIVKLYDAANPMPGAASSSPAKPAATASKPGDKPKP